jgi:ribosome-binding protein aMBF1 (putative translation factor)
MGVDNENGLKLCNDCGRWFHALVYIQSAWVYVCQSCATQYDDDPEYTDDDED